MQHAIDYRTADVSAEVFRLTNGRGVDVVLDPIGGRSFATSYRLLAPLGRLVVYGVSSIAPGERRSVWRAATTLLRMPRFKPLSLMNRNRGVFGLNLGHLWDERRQLAKSMRYLLDEVGAGRLRPVVARTISARAGRGGASLHPIACEHREGALACAPVSRLGAEAGWGLGLEAGRTGD